MFLNVDSDFIVDIKEPLKKKTNTKTHKPTNSSLVKKIYKHFIDFIESPTSFYVVLSTFPFLFFLFFYSCNKHFHILPLISDLPTSPLLNLSTIDTTIFFGQSPQQIISLNHNFFLDVCSALPYLLHYTLPVLYPFLLYTYHKSSLVAHFFLLLAACMWIQYLIWYVFPSGPPWLEMPLSLFSSNLTSYTFLHIPPFLQLHFPPKSSSSSSSSTSLSSSTSQINFYTSIFPHGCAFKRLDQASGVTFFQTLFSNNPVPFASLPSGHVAWPFCMLLTSWPSSNKASKMGMLAHVVYISWASVYTCHHYAFDVVVAFVLVFVLHRFFITPFIHKHKKVLFS